MMRGSPLLPLTKRKGKHEKKKKLFFGKEEKRGEEKVRVFVFVFFSLFSHVFSSFLLTSISMLLSAESSRYVMLALFFCFFSPLMVNNER